MNQTTAIHDRSQTVCCKLTGVGRSAIAVVAIEGPHAADYLQQCFRTQHPRPLSVGDVRYGTWSTQDQIASESVVVVPIAADQFEIHSHGGTAAAKRIVEDLCQLGASEINPQSARHIDSAQDSCQHSDQLENDFIAEAEQALVACVTTKTAAIVLDQVRGAMGRWRNKSLRLIEDSPDRQGLQTVIDEAEQIAAAGKIGVRLSRPFDVVLCGPPNVGKSSLINAMVGYDRSITMDVAGTTRDVLDAETVFNGWPIRLRDTAGLHQAGNEIERQGIGRALEAVKQADLLVIVNQPNEEHSGSFFQQALDDLQSPPPQINVLNKADLEADRAPIGEQKPAKDEDIVRTVATNGGGIETLINRILDCLVASIPPQGSPVPISERQLQWVQGLAKASSLDELRQRLVQCSK
ncbi:50S ribosome-binding GTPase [Stieleria sp. JC731]|uniref:GTPase n=1 Tax=Pirellulaceae TaxID=2691357 RepID=UPI001E471EBE|nr:GTPase [Stieleria sp. JC731]MCC9600650.1 50S ribosome-binding GTPase [Stieleria sp. JC731]